MKSVQQARAAAKSLRKELANLEKPVGELSLNETQHLLARALGYDNWNTLIPTLESTPLEALKASKVALPRDEIPVGMVGALETLDGETIIGSFDSLRACAMIQGAARQQDGTLEIDWEGTTDVWWDEQRTVHENGEPLFVTEACNLVPLSQVRLVASDDSNNEVET